MPIDWEEVERRRLAHVTELEAEVAALRAQRLDILARWYAADYSKCAAYCDEVLDRSGRLLGEVRDARAALTASETPPG